MERRATPTTGQRVCLAVGAAAALFVIARGITIVWTGGPSGGWFMYQPDSEVASDLGDGYRNDALKEAGVWLVAIVVWLLIVWRTFTTPDSQATD